MKAIVSYIPVPHMGYLKLIERHRPADVVLLSLEVIRHIDPSISGQIERDFSLRAIPLSWTKELFQGKFGDSKIIILDNLEQLKEYQSIVMPDEDISHSLEKLTPWATVEYDTWHQRWDWRNTNIPKEVISDYEISTNELDRYFMSLAEKEAQKSSDFWRRVGAVVSTEHGLLTAYNEHLPTEMEPYINGDIRGSMLPGEKPEICGALHGEKGIFAKALLEGISMRGRDMYVTTFPCLPCAQWIALSGIKRLFFRDGYSNQNAQEDLYSKGVQIIRVQ